MSNWIDPALLDRTSKRLRESHELLLRIWHKVDDESLEYQIDKVCDHIEWAEVLVNHILPGKVDK